MNERPEINRDVTTIRTGNINLSNAVVSPLKNVEELKINIEISDSVSNDLFRDTVNFKTSWKEPISHYYECIGDGYDSRKAMRSAKRAFKMNKDEYNEFKRRVQAM